MLALAACDRAATPVHTDPVDTDLPLAADTDVLVPAEDTDDTDIAPVPDVVLALGDEVRCADPSARDLAVYAPPLEGGDWALQPFDPERLTRFTGGGITAADVDGDGALDLIRPDLDAVRLWLQTSPSVFTDARDHLPAVLNGTNVVTPTDVDGDGDLDLFLGRQGRANVLWINDGAGRFTDGTEAAGLAVAAIAHTTSAAFADYDRDGDLDLFVGNYGSFATVQREPGDPKVLWRNRGDGTFDDMSTLLPPAIHDGYTFVAGWWDAEHDGWPDLLTVNDFGQQEPNRFMRNTAGTFTLDDGTAGLDVRMQGMGLGVGDLNGDGIDDVTLAGWNNHHVMLSSSGAWFDGRAAMGFAGDTSRRQSIAWASEMADLDNDGDLDVAMGFGYIRGEQAARLQPDEIFRHDGAAFTPAGAAWGFAHVGHTRGVLAVDMNNDGWLDLLRADLVGPATVQLAACGSDAWLRVSVQDERVPNQLGVGVEIRATAGEQRWSRTIVSGGRSVLSAGPPIAYFGLGDVDVLDTLTVVWTDGTTTEFEDVPTRRPVVIRRAALPSEP